MCENVKLSKGYVTLSYNNMFRERVAIYISSVVTGYHSLKYYKAMTDIPRDGFWESFCE